MSQETLFRLSRRAAAELLRGLDVEEQLARIRRYVELAEAAPAESLRGAALLDREKMEVLGGITEHLSQTLEASRSLLRHLIANGA